MTSPKLEQEFDVEMMNIYLRAKKDVGYVASYFHQMLCEHKGVRTAKILINSPKISAGYAKLEAVKRLDLTVEALVVETARFHPLFSADELSRAAKRLKSYGYEPKIAQVSGMQK